MKYYQISVTSPGGHIGNYINMNISPEQAIEQTKASIGMENTQEFIDSCTYSVIEVIKHPTNKYEYIPVL